MAFRGGGGGGGGRGGRRGKNRPSPYNMKDGKSVSWGGNKGQQDPQQGGEILPLLPNPVVVEGAEQTGVTSSEPHTEGDNSTAAPPPPPTSKKFTNKARLFFGNLPRDFTEEELRNMLAVHGEIQEIYHNRDKNFAFARMVRLWLFLVSMTSLALFLQAYRSDAEKVIAHYNGLTVRSRDIKVRFAASSASVKVSNINPTVSNELLAEAFSQFGDVEEAVIATDDRGKPLGYGIVDFARKGQAMSAIQQCRNDPFLITK